MKTRTESRIMLSCAVAAVLFFLAAAAPVRAATLYWDGGAVDIGGDGNGVSAGGAGTWNTNTLNWDQGAVLPYVNWTNANNDTAVFSTTGGKVSLGTAVTVGGLMFDVGGFEVTNNTLTFGAAGSITVATNTQSVLASVLAGTQTITKDGAGKFVLRGTSTRTGATVVASGSLRLENAAGFGAATAPVTINSGGTLEIGTATSIANGTGVIALNNGGTIAAETTGAAGRIDKQINVEASGSAVVTFSSGGNANNILTISGGGNNRLAGGATGAKIQIVGSGEVNIGESGQTRTNAVVADWYLQGGKFRIRGDDELGNDANQIFFEGGTFLTDGVLSLDGSRVLNFGHGSGGTVDTTGGNFTLGAAGHLAGTGSLTKAGANSLIIGAANAGFSGDISVLAGSLVVTNPAVLEAGSDVSVAGNATLSGDGTIGGKVQIAQYGNLSAGASTGAIGTLTLTDSSTNALTLNGVALTVDLPASGTNCDLVAISGGLVLNGGNTVFINAPNGAEPGTYTLMSYAAVSGSGTLVFANGTTNLGNASIAVNAGAVTMTIGAGGLSNSVWKGTVSGVWDGGALNWTKNGVASQAFADGDHVTFDNSASTFTVTSAAQVVAASVSVNSTSNYTFTARIGGAGTPLIKSGSGTLTLGTNSYGGGTIINAGTVMLTAIGMDTNIGTGAVTVNRTGTLTLNNGSGGVTLTRALTLNGGTLKFFGSGANITASGSIVLAANSTVDMSGNNSGVQTITGTTSGPGGLTVINSPSTTILGLVRLNGTTNSYEGPTVVTIGGLTVKSSFYGNDTAKWTPANITVSNGAALMLNVGGAGEFTIVQAATLFSNLATSVSNNGLRAGSTIGVDTRNASGSIIFSGIITDSIGTGGGSVNFKHTGGNATTTLELTGSNTYSGTTIVDNGSTLKVSSLNSVVTDVSKGTVHSASSSLGAPTSAANGKIWLGSGGSPSNLGNTFQGGSLTYTGTGETSDRVISLNGGGGESYRLDQSGSGLLKFISAFTMGDSRGTKTITLQGSTVGTGEIASVIPSATSGNGTAITKSGSGTWILSAANANSGGVFTVTGGALVLGNSNAVPGGIGPSGGLSAITLNGGVIGLGTNDFTRNLAAAGAITGVNFTGNGGWAAYGADRVVNLGGTSAPITWATANTGFNARTLILGNATASHTIDFQNPVDLGAAARTVQVDDGAAATDAKLSGVIIGSVGGNLIKTGGGTLELTGTNTYTGATIVSTGTLLLADGTLAGTSGITNNARLVFSPSGTITAAYPIRGTGTITKAGLGVLTLSGASTYTGPFIVSNGTLLVNGTSGSGPLTVMSGGTLGGTGTLGGSVTSGGTVEPGDSVGQLNIAGNYAQTGALNIQLGSGSNDILAVTGTAQLGGTLNVTLVGGYVPQTNDIFVILIGSAGITDGFATTNLASPGGGNEWVVEYQSSAVVLSITNAGGPPPPTGYNAFSNLNVLVQGPEGDDDGDGFANLYEYVTGSNPTNGGSNVALSATRTNGLFALKFLRDTNTVDATLIVEGSYATTNDAEWIGFATNISGSWGAATNVVEGTNSPVSVTAFDVVPSATNRFLRLRVTRP